MQVRFYIDPQTGRPHVETHGIATSEVVQALERAGQDYLGQRGARVAIGPTAANRVLQVIYTPDEGLPSVFVITAYRLKGKELKAYRRRLKRRGKK